ncbi:MAG: uridine phosphorylase [Thermodesulfobacteriota bacterium]
MALLYHIRLDKKSIEGAQTVFLPGDPARVEPIARAIATATGGGFSPLASNREFTTCIAGVKGRRVLVTSTGIGGPSTSIAVDELAQIGVRTFIRVGTTGAIQARIRSGDCVITTGAVRLDGASTHYAPIEYPAVADFDVVGALLKSAQKHGVRSHTGVTASSDTFYPGEERRDAFRKYVLRRFRGATEEMRQLCVLNYEMEAATLFTMTASMGLRGGCVTGVVNRGSTGKVTPQALKKGTANAIKVAAGAIEFL